MSKKKAFSGNTMTLKDFHGGFIPTDLPLPSAPGVIVRSSEWSGYDRPNSWGGPMSRPDRRARPNSSPATRHFDDKTPFLNHTAHIGRHFDEDERKPLDGVSTPRRTVSDDSFRAAPGKVELRPEPITSGRVSGSVAVSQVGSSYSGRVSEGAHAGANSPNVGGNVGQGVGGGSYPNVWVARKELAVGVNEPSQSAWSGASAVSKLADASALKQVSSGRWQTNHSIQYQAEVEVIDHLETERDAGSRGHDVYANNRMGTVGGREYSDATLASYLDRGLAPEDRLQSGRKENVDHERTRAVSYSALKERNISTHGEQAPSVHADGRFSGSDLQPPVQHEALERPKVKLLPRTKPLVGLEAPVVDYKQGYQQLSSSANGHADTYELHGNNNALKSGLAGVESENQAIERPKLNMKPRSQPVEQSEENREKERTRSSEWCGYDRPNSWGGPIGQPNHSERPYSSPATRHFDDKTPFLNHTAHIGHRFDEGEHMALDGISTPCQTVSDDSFRIAPGNVVSRPEPITSGRVSGSVAVSQVASLYSGRVSEGAHVGANSQNVGQGVGGGSYPNVWAARKELAVGLNEPVQSAWSGASAVSKLANASALKQVSSGRWQTKHSIQYQTEVEVIDHLETESDVGSRGHDVYANNRMGAVGGREYSDATLARHLDRVLAPEDRLQSGRKEYVDHERTRGVPYSALKERSISTHDEQAPSVRADGRFGGSDLQPPVQSEASERPKVKLLPRTKLLEGPEAPVVDYKQGYKQLSNSANGHADTYELHGSSNASKSGLAGVESENQGIERPKLNMKPRSQPVEQSEENREKKRSSEWSGYDYPNSWGGPMGQPDHRACPNLSPATRHFDDKTPFLNHTAHIGHHFDEGEGKPLDGVSTPRRTVSDDSFRVAPGNVESRPEPIRSGRVSGSVAVSQVASSCSGRVSEGAHVGANSLNVGDNVGQGVGGGSYPNVWAARKELAAGVNEPVQSAWSEASAVSKLANASALKQVSSGRWQTNHSIQYQAEVEVIDHLETERDVGSRGHDVYVNNRIGAFGGREYSNATLAMHLDRGLAPEDRLQSGRKENVDHERTRAVSYSALKERNISTHGEQAPSVHADGRFSGSDLQPPVQHEALERPKVKLLPRTKPLVGLEAPVVDYKQGYQQLSSSANGHADTYELHGNNNALKSGLAGVESENQAIERPKLNMKPRSQPVEQSEENREKERIALFGGARPREVVLKERGVDGAAISNHDLGVQPDRVKHNVPKTESGSEHAIPSRHGERTDNMPLDERAGKKFERKDQRMDIDRVDKQRRNWRNENWKNSRETERQQHAQLQQERPPSPETWRKPVEQPKPASLDGTGLRYGKFASALELAQAFSKSFSDQKPADRYFGQRGLPGKTEIPFSRLTSPTPRPQINGY